MSLNTPNVDNNDIDFMREESVYIEQDNDAQRNEQRISNNELIISHSNQGSTNSIRENRGKRISCTIKSRKENDSRWVAEQTVHMRERFDLPTDDELLASCSAALLKRILLQGRLYITTHHICFYATLFGKVTKETFPYISLAKVEKRRGGLVVNAIKIYFTDEDVAPIIIGSLNNRERVFTLIQERLHLINLTASFDQHGNGDEKSESFPGNASEVVSTLSNTVSCAQLPPILSLDSLTNDAPVGVSAVLHTGTSEVQRKSFTDDIITEMDTLQAMSPATKQLQWKAREWLNSLVWYTEKDILPIFLTSSYKNKTERARAVLTAPVKEVFNILYISDWLKEYHDQVKNYNVDIMEWERDDTGRMCRDVRFRRPLQLRVGPKETRVEEKQWATFTGEGCVVIEVQGNNLDVPYSSYFKVESFFELSPINNGADTLLVASVNVRFSKSTLLQGQIESGALSETETAYGKLVTLAKERIGEHVLERATAEMSKPLNMAIKRKSGVSPGFDKVKVKRRSITTADESEKDQSVVEVAKQAIIGTPGEKKLISSSTVSGPLDYAIQSESTSSNDTASNTATNYQRATLVYFCLGASLIVVFVACILLAILVMHVERLIRSVKGLIYSLENEVNVRRC